MTNTSHSQTTSFVQEQAKNVLSFCRNLLTAVSSVSGTGSQCVINESSNLQLHGKQSSSSTEPWSSQTYDLNGPLSPAVDSSDQSRSAPVHTTFKIFSQEVLDFLDRATLEHIAATYNTSPSILEILSRHHSPDVRAAVAENVNAPPCIIAALAGDDDPSVRYQLAENPHLPITILQSLADDDNAYVAFRAKNTLERLSCLIACASD